MAALVVAGVALPGAPPAAAQPAGDDAVFRRGLSLYDAGDYAGAIATWETLRESIGRERGWKLLYNLGLAYQALGDVTHAIARYEAFLDAVAKRADVQPELRDRTDDATQRLHTLESTYGAVQIRAPSSGAIVMTRVGMGDVRPAGYTLWLSPGDHDVEVGTGTSRAHHVQVTVAAGRTVDVPTDDVALPSQAPTNSSPAPVVALPQKSARHFPMGWVLVSAGTTLASAALPIVLGLRASSKRDDAQQMGAGSTGYAQAVSDYGDARSLYYYSYAVPALLGAVTATIVVLGLVNSASSDARTEVRASADARGGSVWLGGSF